MFDKSPEVYVDLIGPAIKSAQTFEELYVKIKNIGDIAGNRQTYSPEFLKEIIEKVRNYEEGYGLDRVTIVGGLREKVEILMKKELGEGLSLENSILYVESLENLRTY